MTTLTNGSSFGVFERVVCVQAFIAAVRTGLFDRLLEGPATREALADCCGVNPEALDRLLGLFEADGIVERGADGWEASNALRRVDELPMPLVALCDLDGHCVDYLREGSAMAERASSDYPNAVEKLGAMFAACAGELASRLEFRPSTVLDLGAGSGVFGLAVAREHGSEQVVGVDREDVLPRFVERATSMGLAGVATPLAADFLRAPLPTGYDCTMICNVLRILEPADAEAMIRRAATTIDDEGRLVIVDVMGPDGPEVRLRRAAYRLTLALRHPSGGPHSAARLEAWLQAAGLQVTARLRLESGPMRERAIIARRGD